MGRSVKRKEGAKERREGRKETSLWLLLTPLDMKSWNYAALDSS